ncbi:hypothetical protein PV10_06883 [Exophiala mesophila]|uniref:Amidase domain-containing protein n=1 Tax=Exophiala mesophila TaxID=212818 RepID=A0A0D1ZRW0_EXOME|nr:uncharacterized protein PV10_06883 [Exophiala mesophila]KIV89488.1 hypothetical protein PV10_06883 [Exophiala mesophila]
MSLFTRLAWTFFVPLSEAYSSPFDPREATVSTVHDALFSGATTCRDVVSSFIARIEAYNPFITAIITLNPEALQIADVLDASLASGNTTGSLFCVPILLKDNFDALPMPTTGGSLALKSSVPLQDGPTVLAFRRAGAVILGKTNLHELALEGLGVSSLGGQTLNPYDFSRTAGGSSSGTGAAIAASFAVFGTGTDTVNSLRSPASANSLYSFRPTRGLISRAGVIPVSHTQDTVGAIGRDLFDIATALTVMSSVGYDPADNDTANIPPNTVGVDYTSFLSSNNPSDLSGIRLGVLEGFFNRTLSSETDPVNQVTDSAIEQLRRQGATLISISDTSIYNATTILQLDVQQFEIRELLTDYLSSEALSGPHPTSMADIFINNTSPPNFLVIPSQYNKIRSALTSSTDDALYLETQARIADLSRTLHETITSNQLDAIIYPEQQNLVVKVGSPSQSGRNGILAALTGSPVITMPIGFSPPGPSAPIGVPIGLELLGLPWSEGKLLRIAKGLDDRLHARRMPVTAGLHDMAEVTTAYSAVPRISLVDNIPPVYPLGRF